jgi:hypothetical protein
MVYKTRNYWVSGLCPSSGILRRNQETQRFENWICFRPQVAGETPTLLGTIEIGNFCHWSRAEPRQRVAFGKDVGCE